MKNTQNKKYDGLADLLRKAAAAVDNTNPRGHPMVAELEDFACLLDEDASNAAADDQPHADTVRLNTLAELMGYVQDGSDTTVTLFQDDATRDYMVAVGDNPMKRTTYYGSSLRSAIDDATKRKDQ